MTTAHAVRLPSGRRSRNTLTRADVAENQRGRIVRAMADAVAEVGYARTTIAQVIAAAGVSRATFYEQFSDKQDCFLATYDLAVDALLRTMAATASDSLPALLDAYLDTLVRNEALARVLLLDIQSLGADGVLRRARSAERIRDRRAVTVGARSAADRFACESFVAAVGSLVTVRLAERDPAGITALRKPLVQLAVRMFGERGAGSAGMPSRTPR